MTSEATREQARQILSEKRFQQGSLPRPLHGFFEALGRRLQPIGDAANWVVRHVDALVPGDRGVVWALAGILVLLAAAFGASRTLRRRVTLLDRERTDAIATAAGRSPEDLERDAAAAEAAGELDAALRLRFSAGLARLAARGLVELRPSTSNAEIARRLRREEFERLACRFDATVYGGRPARPADLDAAREDWAALLVGGMR